ncbi:hypothetical protein [Amycolatopsis sp. NPDC021455]|uniref:hypothetical protein n=1 Tax=Amycolatopsis sp. NPDC021455 TaxID=3154901 RepID=UPI0033FDE2D4
MEDIAGRVANTPPPDIRIDHVAVFDWYDGPLEGYLRIADPASCWYFKVIAVRRPDDDVDDRLYALSAAPDDVLDQLGDPLSATEETWDRLKRALPGPSLIVRSTSLNDVSAVWLVSDR